MAAVFTAEQRPLSRQCHWPFSAEYPIEFDFGKKWAESLGQALYYSLQTGNRAGIVLILEGPQDRKYWIRLNSTIEHFRLPIETWEMEEE